VGAWLALLLLSVWAVAYGLALQAPSFQTKEMTWLFSSLFGRAPVFVFGMVGAVLYTRHGTAARAWLASHAAMRNGGADLILAGTVLLLLVLLRRVAAYDIWVSERAPVVVWHLAAAALWAVVVGLLLVAPLRTGGLLCNPLLAWLGTVSYSVYLWHVPLTLHLLLFAWPRFPGVGHDWDLPSLPIIASITAAVMGVSWLSYILIEQPFLRYKAKLD
jgi:peptidoglycan/LPS O-acetylase OafA/YrhL